MVKILENGLLEHTCYCGQPAYFGENVNLRRALEAHHKGQIDLATELLGQWFCIEHKVIGYENNTKGL